MKKYLSIILVSVLLTTGVATAKPFSWKKKLFYGAVGATATYLIMKHSEQPEPLPQVVLTCKSLLSKPIKDGKICNEFDPARTTSEYAVALGYKHILKVTLVSQTSTVASYQLVVTE